MKAIVGTDGSPCAQIAVDLAAALPWPAGSMLRVVTAHDPVSFYGPFAGFAPGVGDAQEGLARALEDSAEAAELKLAGDGRSVDHRVLVGRPSAVLRKEAETFGADLILVGSRGHGRIANMLLGSVSAEVIDHVACPVLVARGTKLKRVILAHDGSDNAFTAERILGAWPIFQHVRIDIVSVAAPVQGWDSIAATEAGLPAERIGDLQAESQHQHQEIAATAARRLTLDGHESETIVPVGDPAHMLTTIAEQDGADLIVMGTRGNTGLKRLLLGSVARNVLTHAKCSVLVVPRSEPSRSTG